ncbi:MAG: mandelate racemase/muconate lactonizing enzyme family protein [Chloroflexi bacterium]|nr:mandelate racemase/muconate lactonizing enzyme family protein [Chloroflexota bacterium]MYK62539.1 mandelate racemase/muconate lactonizing enzyme family protein [Chloroflexota bacterium]
MKITKITPYLVSAPAPFLPTSNAKANNREYLFVEVNTDEGVTGWGEVTCTRDQANRGVASLIRHVSDLLEGDDPKNIEKIWHKVFRHFTYMGSRGATTSVISGIDIALWDIRGKVLGVPVYELLGGPVRDAVDVYCHPQDGATPESLAQDCKAIVATGQTSLKTDPWYPHHPDEIDGYMSGKLSADAENQGVERIAAAREAVGPDIEILIDNHARFDVPTAIRLANSLEPYDIFWFEEPVGVESNTALKQVRDATNVPICVGERIHTRWEFVPILEQGLADFIMPDITWTGGISELKKICTQAETYYIPVSPHDASGPINVIAGAQVMITVPNCYRVETMRADLHAYDVLMDVPLDIRGDKIHLDPDRPGIGIEMDREYLQAHLAD